MKICSIIFIFTFIHISLFAIDKEYEAYQNSNSKVLIKNIKTTDYTALLEPISYVVLDSEEDLPDVKEKCSYYNMIIVYKVLETYKGDLPEYILIRDYGEYCGKFDKKRYSIIQKNTIIRSLCKGVNHYYEIEKNFAYKDTQFLRNIAREVSKNTATTVENNQCKERHRLFK